MHGRKWSWAVIGSTEAVNKDRIRASILMFED
jgi:hypothetical protein